MNIFDLVGTIAIQGMDTINSQMTSLGMQAATLGDRMTTFGNTLVNNVTKPIVNLVTEGVKYNMSMEDLKTSFDVMLGSAEKAGVMLDKLKDMAAKTPFDTEQLATYTKTLLAFGYTEENVIPIMSRLGDVSLGNNATMQSLTRTMGQINSLGRLQGGDLNQLIGQGWNPLNEITARTGETMEQVRDRMSKGKVSYKEVEQALKDATSAGGRFYKGMDKGSQTTSGKISTLRDNFMSFLGSAVEPLSNFIGQKLVPYLINLTDKFSGLDAKTKTTILIIAGIVASIGPLILILGTLIGVMGSAIAAIGGIGVGIIAAISALGLGSAAFVGFGGNISDVKEKIISIKDKIVEFAMKVVEFVKPIGEMFKNTFKGLDWTPALNALNSLKNAAIAVMPFVKDFAILLGTVLATAISVVVGVFNGLLAALPNIIGFFSNIVSAVMSFVNIVYGLLTGNWEMLKAGAIGFVNSVIGIYNNFVNTISNFIKGLVNGIITFFQSLYNTLVGHSIIPDMVNAIINAFINLKNQVTNFVSALVSSVINFFNNLKNNAVSTISSFVSLIVGRFNSLVSQGRNLIQGLVNAVRGILSGLAGIASSAFGNFVNAISHKIGSARNAAQSVVNAVKNAITSLSGALYNAGQNLIQSLVNGIMSMIGRVKNAAGNVASAIKNLIGWKSPTKEGPGSDSDEWALNLMNMITEGIDKNLDKVKFSASKIAGTIKNSVNDVNLSPTMKTSDEAISKDESTRINTLNIELRVSDLKEIQTFKEFLNRIKVESIARGGTV